MTETSLYGESVVSLEGNNLELGAPTLESSKPTQVAVRVEGFGMVAALRCNRVETDLDDVAAIVEEADYAGHVWVGKAHPERRMHSQQAYDQLEKLAFHELAVTRRDWLRGCCSSSSCAAN